PLTGFEEQGNRNYPDDFRGHGKGLPVAPFPEGRGEGPLRVGPVRLEESDYRATAGRREGSTARRQRHARPAIPGAGPPGRATAGAAGTATLRTLVASGSEPVLGANPGTDSQIPANCAGNWCQSRVCKSGENKGRPATAALFLSLGRNGRSGCLTVLGAQRTGSISRGETPGQTTRFRQTA